MNNTADLASFSFKDVPETEVAAMATATSDIVLEVLTAARPKFDALLDGDDRVVTYVLMTNLLLHSFVGTLSYSLLNSMSPETREAFAEHISQGLHSTLEVAVMDALGAVNDATA